MGRLLAPLRGLRRTVRGGHGDRVVRHFGVTVEGERVAVEGALGGDACGRGLSKGALEEGLGRGVSAAVLRGGGMGGAGGGGG